ncbi:MAG: DUF962 domain-containing protein [bacterium]|nr:DUF962 domain-containing protein [bacterium]MDV2479864.1 Mpo1-like protein [bacterium]
MDRLRWFVRDYIERHSHPVNTLLHLVGVPAALYGLVRLLGGALLGGFGWLVLGYALQWIGHRAQGNEVGEWILLKSLAAKLRRR